MNMREREDRQADRGDEGRPATRDIAGAAAEPPASELGAAESWASSVDGDVSAAADTARRRARSSGGRGRRRQVKILFVAANPRVGRQLALDEEYRAIERSIRVARHRDAFQLIPQLAARRGDLQQALLEHSPDVVHFACHGSAGAEVLLRGDGPDPEPMSADALASLFRVLQDNLALVVFNACFAGVQASAIRQHAGVTIGMREQIEDKLAIA